MSSIKAAVIQRAQFRAAVVAAILLLCYAREARAEDKEPLALVELGPATERSLQDGATSAGALASVEFPVVKEWLEIETGISFLFRPGQAEWQADLLFKKPFTLNEKVEFMIGVGPEVSYATADGGTKIASEGAGVDDLAIERAQVWLVRGADLQLWSD